MRIPRRRKQAGPASGGAGFSLPELMVVLAIIMLIVSLAVPRYKKAKQLAEDAAAQATLKSIHTAEEAHRITHGEYAPSFKILAGPGGSLPEVAGGDAQTQEGSGESVMVYHGYIYRLKRPLTDEYTVTAEPVEDRGSRPSFTLDQTGTLTASGGQGAAAPVGATKPKKPQDQNP